MNEFLKFFRGRWNSVVDSREKRKSIWSCRKKNYATLIVVFNLWAAWAAPKKHQKFNLIFFIILNISISTRKVMIYSMFIYEVNNIRSFVLGAVMTSLRKNKI
jgi:hypothetical protein